MLKFKYKKKLQMTEKQYLIKFIKYKMLKNIFIKKV